MKTSTKLNVLMCALHAELTGYIGGGWVRVIELLKIASSYRINFSLIETKPSFKNFYNLNYEALEIPQFLNRTFIGRLLRLIFAVKLGVARAKNGDIHLIHSPVELPECVLPSYFISKITRLPWVAEVHLIPLYSSLDEQDHSKRTSSFRDLYYESRRRGISIPRSFFISVTQWMVFKAFRNGKLMLAPSRSVVEDMLIVDPQVSFKEYFPGNGINVRRIDSVPRESKQYDGIYVGVLTDKKGIFDAIKVWSLIVEKRPNSCLVVIGRGSEEQENKMKNLLKEMGLEENVEFPFDLRRGAPTLEDVWSTMKKSKILVHLSRSDAWPQVIGEAIACGLPVVTYDLRPQKYSFGQCPIVFRIPARDLKACANTILEIIDEYSTDKYLNIAQSFVKKYTWDKVMAAEKRAFLDVINTYKVTNANK